MIPGRVLGKKYTINGILADAEGFTPDMSAEIYYEVVRLIGGKFLFLHDHLERLRHSLSGSGWEYPGDGTIRESLKLLQSGNDIPSGNIRICIQVAGKGQQTTARGTTLLCYYIPYFYPEPEMYGKGVRLSIYPHVRPNPGIKKWDDRFRTSVGRFIRDQGIYEAILMNGRSEVTEGSRSNLFFIDHGNELVTAPEKDILPGITRKYLLEICHRENIVVCERPVWLNDLGGMMACFITGTSPKVLPVRELDGFTFNVDNPVLRFLMEEFDQVLYAHLESLTSG